MTRCDLHGDRGKEVPGLGEAGAGHIGPLQGEGRATWEDLGRLSEQPLLKK